MSKYKDGSSPTRNEEYFNSKSCSVRYNSPNTQEEEPKYAYEKQKLSKKMLTKKK